MAAMFDFDQTSWIIGDDDNADPDGCTWDTEATRRTGVAKETLFIVRIQIAETGGDDSGNNSIALYYNTSASTAGSVKIQVDPNGNAVEFVDATPTDGDPTDDNTVMVAEGGKTWQDGEYSESANSDKMVLGSGKYTDIQFGIQFTANATAGQVYYFHLRHGSDIPTNISYAEVQVAADNLLVSVVDTISMNDNASPDPVELPGVSITETISLADAFGPGDIPLPPSLSDGMSLSDAIAAAVDLVMNASDSLSFSEALSLVLSDLVLNASDTISMADVANAALEGNNLEVVASDTFGFLEDLTARMNLAGINIADTISFVDSIAARMNLRLSAADTLALSDSLAVDPITLPASASEGLSLSDVVTLFMNMGGINIADSFNINELLSKGISIEPRLSDSFNLSDVGAISPLRLRLGPSETITISDVLNALVGMGQISLSDSFALVDSANVQIAGLDILLSVSDAFGIGELVAGALSLPGFNIGDSFSFTENVNVIICGAEITPEKKILVGIHDGNIYLKIGGAVTEI
ncbi:MAG: hypothetical protein ACYS1A_18220 [Planctomycetota bacterium]|jgi:hypothetical protein